MRKLPKETKAGDVYRRAAELIRKEREMYSCCAVDSSVGHLWTYNTQERMDYASVMNPFGWNESSTLQPSHILDHCDWLYQEAKNLRVLMLLMMAAIVDAGDLEEMLA